MNLESIRNSEFVKSILSRIDAATKNAENIKAKVLIAQPRRTKTTPPIQNLWTPEHVNHPFGAKLKYAVVDGRPVDEARNTLCQAAIDMDIPFVLFADDDTAFPVDGIQKLLKKAEDGCDMVSGVYTQKYYETPYAVIANIKDSQVYVPDLSPAKELIECNWLCGTGCFIVKTTVLKKLKEVHPELPFCCMLTNELGQILMGEDFFFTQRVLEAGYKVFIDRSMQCLHVDMDTGNYWCHERYTPDLSFYLTTIKLKERNITLTKNREGPDKYDPCPCKSGKKFKFCCGKDKDKKV